MANKHSTEKSSIGPNQSHSWEVKYLAIASKKPFEVPSDFILSQFIEWYPLDIPTQPTLDLSYTSSPNIPHQVFSSNKELRCVSFEEPLYFIPKTEVNQLHRHTQGYLKSLGQIPIIYSIPRSWFSRRRTQPYGDSETFTSSTEDLIIDTISEIHQPITKISHSETSQDPEFWDLMYFQEEYPTFFDFPKTQEGGYGPPKPPKTSPPLASIPSPQLNFTFGGSMASNQPWLVINALSIPGPHNPLSKHPEKPLPKFDPDNDIEPEDHMNKFMLSLNLINVQHEDVVCRLFCFTL